MLKFLKQRLIDAGLPVADQKKVDIALRHINSAGFDEWGVDPELLKLSLALSRKLYTDYFRVETVGIENIPEGRALLVANHGGQIPLDGFLVGMSLILDAFPPRIARGMVERWAPGLPFVSVLFNRLGQMVGDHRICRDLLEHDECVLVFPEGVAGSGKTLEKKYRLQKFGTGFVRLALETRAPIVPVAIIGCEEAYPAIYNLKFLAKFLRAPYFPITPFFPLLGPLGLLPLPCKVTLYYGKPIRLEGDPDAPDAEIDLMVAHVRNSLQGQIESGIKKRAGHIFKGAAK